MWKNMVSPRKAASISVGPCVSQHADVTPRWEQVFSQTIPRCNSAFLPPFGQRAISGKTLPRLPSKLLAIAFYSCENILIWNYSLKHVLPKMEHNTPNMVGLVPASFFGGGPKFLLTQSQIAVVFWFCFSCLLAHFILWHADPLRSQWSGSSGSLPTDTCSADFLNPNLTHILDP